MITEQPSFFIRKPKIHNDGVVQAIQKKTHKRNKMTIFVFLKTLEKEICNE